MKKRKLITLILLCSILLSACGNTASVPSATPSPEPVQETPPAVEDTSELQKELIINSSDIWTPEDNYNRWFYTITDLDHNGLLEITVASNQGTGLYTYADYYEVSPDLLSLNKCKTDFIEGDSWPDIINNHAECYYDVQAGRYYYVFEDILRVSAAESMCSLYGLCLENGNITRSLLATKSTVWSDGGQNPVTLCHDKDGNVISEEDYSSCPQWFYRDFVKSTVYFDWVEIEPSVNEPQTASDPAVPGPAITKNPTSESINTGSGTWFIAHAEEADTLTWILLDTEGREHSMEEAMSLNPGLALQALEDDTLAVSNVPASLNGWGIIARFEKAGGVSSTAPAYIYVGDFENAYASVINQYRSVMENGDFFDESNGSLFPGELLSGCAHIGCALKDLDKNGIPELIIAPMESEEFYMDTILAIYTLSDNHPVQLIGGWARNRYTLMVDNTIINCGSSGAAYCTVEYQKIDGLTVRFIQGWQTFNDSDSSGTTGYHSVTPSSEDPAHGNYNSFDSTFAPDECYTKFETALKSAWTPPLTKIC